MALSKSRRFEIFKRDGFTCQYCGRRPDDGETVLEVDHIHPRSQGGSDDEMNLITACYECNRGKRAKLLAEVSPRPDADARTLELQQETAELRRYQAAVVEHQVELAKTATFLQDLWQTVSTLDWVPQDTLLLQMIAQYGPQIVEVAVRITAPKIQGGYLPRTGTGWVKYMWGVMRNTAEEATPPARELPAPTRDKPLVYQVEDDDYDDVSPYELDAGRTQHIRLGLVNPDGGRRNG